MPMIRRCRFWRRVPAKPRPDDYYLRDERPYGGQAPPAVVYRYSPDRKGEHPRAHLAKFRGFLQADGYSGFGPLYETADGQPATLTEVACWAHVRRKFYDIHMATNAPIAGEALQRIGQLFDIERVAMGRSPDERRRIRQRSARLSSRTSPCSSMPRCRNSPAKANWPAPSAMPARDGRH
jgi:Transposase IS66 family